MNCDNSITHMKSHANDHMQMISRDDLGLCPMEIHQMVHGFHFFFSWIWVGLHTESQDITIKT